MKILTLFYSAECGEKLTCWPSLTYQGLSQKLSAELFFPYLIRMWCMEQWACVQRGSGVRMVAVSVWLPPVIAPNTHIPHSILTVTQTGIPRQIWPPARLSCHTHSVNISPQTQSVQHCVQPSENIQCFFSFFPHSFSCCEWVSEWAGGYLGDL